MATWIAHLRVAEKLLEKLDNIDIPSFVVGNIGPDSGVPNEDWSAFSPPKTISHWYNEAGEIDAENFRQKYLIDTRHHTKKELSFYLGYYVHLLSDMEWSKLYDRKLEEPIYKDNLEKDWRFIWTIKEDWYGWDHIYLKENKDSVFYKEFIKVREFPNTYFDFFPPEAFTRQVNYISNYYLTFDDNLDREFIYLSKEEMDGYVQETVKVIEAILAENQIENYLYA